MKTNRIDTLALKAKHRLELVMQEAGEDFEANVGLPEQWRSKTTPGLIVDVRRQMYELRRPGADMETGDVIDWLRRRYGWTFGQAVTFLEGRTPDPAHVVATPAPPQETPESTVSVETPALDQLQRRALEIAGDRIRPFLSWHYLRLLELLPEVRVEPVFSPQITACQACGDEIDWKISKSRRVPTAHGGYWLEAPAELPVRAYSIKRQLDTDDLKVDLGSYIGLTDERWIQALKALVNNYLPGLWVEEEDGLVCPRCGHAEIEFQRAVALVKKSAQERWQVELEKPDEPLREMLAEEEHQRERRRLAQEESDQVYMAEWAERQGPR